MNKRILALDIGEKRIGLALSDPTGTIASPYKVLVRKEGKSIISQILYEIEMNNVCEIVAGIPVSLNDTIGPQAQKILKFIEILREKTKIPVFTIDESLTTKTADDAMIGMDVSRKKRKGKIDMLAASVILQSYLREKNEKKT
jgi:putative Holliday junction resolvase